MLRISKLIFVSVRANLSVYELWFKSVARSDSCCIAMSGFNDRVLIYFCHKKEDMSAQKKLVLVDGSSYLYRAYHALPPLSSPDGTPTGVIYGVINMLNTLLKNEEPDCFLVVFDPKGKTSRHKIFPDYKAHRPPMEDDLAIQIGPLFELIQFLGYPLLQVGGIEADDVIGTLACRAQGKGYRVVISTGDKDLMQLVNESITLVNTMNKELYDCEGVKRKMDVFPEQIIDYLALVGDRADNIPGVQGVGPKTAAKWLAEYVTLKNLLEHIDQLRGKVAARLYDAGDVLALSKQLVTIDCKVDIPCEIESLQLSKPNITALRENYTKLGFRKWLGELNGKVSKEAVTTDNVMSESQNLPIDYQLILDWKSFDKWLKDLKCADCFAFNIETTNLEYMSAEIVGISFSLRPGCAAYIPLSHDYDGAPKQLDREEVLHKLKSLLEDDNVKKIGHNLKYNRNVLGNYNICLHGIMHDPMLESYVFNSVASRHDLTSLAVHYLSLPKLSYEDVAGKGTKQKAFNQVVVEDANQYAAENADVCLRLHQILSAKLVASPEELKVYEGMELPLVEVLSDIERKGVSVDVKALKQQNDELKTMIESIKEKIYRDAKESFNLDSATQVRKILFEKQGLPVKKKTPKGEPSTAEDVLRDPIYQDYDLPKFILEYRMYSKLKSTYTDKLPRMVNSITHRVHTSYHQAVTATGRLSSSNPNLQNIPVRTLEGRRIRKAFVAPAGYCLIAADYSQIELRIMAHLSKDEKLCKAFKAGRDIHAATAADIFNTSLESVTSEQRRMAKAVNFGLIYGMSAFGLAEQLQIDWSSAKDYLDSYFGYYPSVKEYMEKSVHLAKKQGYVQTIFNRKLYLPGLNSSDVNMRKYAERAAINAPMQGSAADIIKYAMIALSRRLREIAVDASIIMQVHDELVLEVAVEDMQRVIKECRDLMTEAADLAVPLTVDIGSGKNWGEAH